MSKKILFLNMILLSLFFISCSKSKDKKVIVKDVNDNKFEVIKNSSKPTKPTFKYNFVEVATIPYIGEKDSKERSFKRPSAIKVDKTGNIFIAGISTAKILKFTPDFKFVKSFGGRGVGPGEFRGGPSSMTYYNGKLFAPCYASTETNVYDTDGNFIKKIPSTLSAAFSGQASFNNEIFMNVEKREMKDDKPLVRSSICLLDSNLSLVKKELFVHEKISDKGILPINDMYIRYVGGKNKLYIADVSDKFYKIHVYDTNYNKIMEIRKNYASKLNKDKNANVYKFTNGLGGGFFRKSETAWRNKKFYYKSINYMFVDKNERLWVVSANKNSNIVGKENAGLFVDIFEKGVFLNTIHLPFFKEKYFDQVYFPLFLSGDKIFALDNDAGCVRIFSYDEKE